VDPNGSVAALETAIAGRLRKEGRPILLLDVFQTGAAKAPRNGDVATGLRPKPADDADDEARADAAAGGAKFLTFNVSDDAARVQDIVTAIVYASRNGAEVEIFAQGDAAVWSVFAAAVSAIPVSLHSVNMPTLTSSADYLQHFNVPGILRAGGVQVAERLAHSK
jgi:hypothetical protein